MSLSQDLLLMAWLWQMIVCLVLDIILETQAEDQTQEVDGRFTTLPDRSRGAGRGSGGGAPPRRGSFGRGGSSGQVREWSEKF